MGPLNHRLLSARMLTSDERRALAARRLVTTQAAPYLSSLILAMPAYAVEGLGTLAVDQSARLYLDPIFFAKLDAEQAIGLLLHEASHIIHGHAPRARTKLIDDTAAERWNVAADLTINDDLIDGGFVLPPGGVRCEHWSLPRSKTVETYFELLVGHDTRSLSCGSGATGEPEIWEFPAADISDARGGDDGGLGRGLTALDIDLHRRHTAEQIDTHIQRHGAGSVPGSLCRWSIEALQRPAVPWRDLLRTAVRRPLQVLAGVDDYTFARPNRRRRSGNVILPSTFSVRPNVTVIVDTSGSIGTADLLAFLSEIASMVAQFKIHARDLTVIACDATAKPPIGADVVLRDRQLSGGGGTDMGVGLHAAMDQRPRPDLAIVFTDGHTPWPIDPPPFAVVIALTTDSSVPQTPDWATTVEIGDLDG